MSDVGFRVKPDAGADRAVTARVLEEMPNGVFRVELENRDVALAHPAGQKARNFVRLLPGDRVEVVLTPHDLTRGRITRKL
jgi:translation initiation factor IF-1